LILWRKQGAAVVGDLSFLDGRKGNVVLVGGPQNPRGAALVLSAPEGEKPQMVMLSAGGALLHSRQIIDILCMQERCFGAHGLPLPEDLN
jgi:hypothetical protein